MTETSDPRKRDAVGDAGGLLSFRPALSNKDLAQKTDFRKALAVALIIVGAGATLASFPADDGLRHVGLAFGSERSWGEVYPHSIFEEHAGYNPWLGHDLLLRGLARAARALPLSLPTAQLLVTRTAGLILVGLLLFFVVRRGRLVDEVSDGPSFLVALILVVVLLAQPLARFSLIRPFAWGTLYLLFAAGSRSGKAGLLGGILSSTALFFFYPYLAWLYTLPAAAAHLLRGSRVFAAGAALATAAVVALQPPAFFGLIVDLARAEQVRAELLPQIGEFLPLVSAVAIPALVLLLWLAFRPRFSSRAEPAPPARLLLLFYIPLALKHLRYFIDVVLVLLLVAYGAELVRALRGPAASALAYWRGRLDSLLPPPAPPAPASERAAAAARPRRSLLRPVLVVLYLAAFALLVRIGAARFGELEQLRGQLAIVPRGALVLTEFNLQYRLLYVRPDLRLVPSCELGFPRRAVQPDYVRFFNEGDACGLALRIGAAFLVEQGGTYIDPRRSGCLRLVLHQPARDRSSLRIWQVDEGAQPRGTGAEVRRAPLGQRF